MPPLTTKRRSGRAFARRGPEANDSTAALPRRRWVFDRPTAREAPADPGAPPEGGRKRAAYADAVLRGDFDAAADAFGEGTAGLAPRFCTPQSCLRLEWFPTPAERKTVELGFDELLGAWRIRLRGDTVAYGFDEALVVDPSLSAAEQRLLGGHDRFYVREAPGAPRRPR
jgi:hypothetical protein